MGGARGGTIHGRSTSALAHYFVVRCGISAVWREAVAGAGKGTGRGTEGLPRGDQGDYRSCASAARPAAKPAECGARAARSFERAGGAAETGLKRLDGTGSQIAKREECARKKSLCRGTGFCVCGFTPDQECVNPRSPNARDRGHPILWSVEGKSLFVFLGGGVIARLGGHVHVGPVDVDIDAAIFRVVDRFVAQVAERVLRASFFGNLLVALFHVVDAAFGIHVASGGRGELVEDVVVHLEGQMKAVNPSLVEARRSADQGGIDGNVVGLQVPCNLFPGGLAAVLLAVRDDEDHAAALLGTRGKLLGRGQDGVVEGVDLLGEVELADGLRRLSGLQIGIGAVAVDGDGAGGEWAAGIRNSRVSAG